MRNAAEPLTPWLLLFLAAAAPLSRGVADDSKRQADGLLRTVEFCDALGREISGLEVEDVAEGAPLLVSWFADRQRDRGDGFASETAPGARRLVENTRESAWWSRRLARENARWEYFWTVALGIACVGTLYEFAISTEGGRQDVAQFAAALLVVVFAEGFLRRAVQLMEFSRAAEKAVADCERLLDTWDASSEWAAVVVVAEYHAARSAAPRLSTVWHRLRQKRLNAAWARAHRRPLPESPRN
jgi:hypothetical protein